MAVLITGMAGFIGFHLANALAARGQEVVGVDNLNDYYDPAVKQARLEVLDRQWGSQVRFHALDFANHDALDSALAGETIDRIAHLGAQAGVRYSLTNPRAYAQSNLVGHLNLLEVARGLNVPMVYASSSSVYGGNTQMPFSVDHRVDHPISLYAATKRSNELTSETYAHLYRLPLTGLRFFTVYGPWGRPDMALWMFTRDILAGKPIPVFNQGQMRRDFTYIDDIIAGVMACLDRAPLDDGLAKPGGSTAPHAIYNIGNNQSEALMDMIATVEAACGKKAIIDFQPMQPGDVHETHADIDAIVCDHGYAPSTPISVGIPNFVNWYRGFYKV